ncbi:MAG: metallophosphoesterase [Eubacteriales bacterium]|nr:metallophosphoesterase [Eubacteriales bacterium]
MSIKCREYDYFYKGQSNLRIVQVSDLHNNKFKNGELIQRIRELSPNLIAVTGDFLDRHRPNDREESLNFFKQATDICTVYCIEGNHEYALKKFVDWQTLIRPYGVRILSNSFEDITIMDSELRLAGTTEKSTAAQISAMQTKERLTITLAHRPERINSYQKADCELVLCGHAHGGQVRIFGQGLFAPEQGVFPKYTRGIYKCGSTTMIVSAGLGNTVCVPRIFDPYELVLINLKCK